MNGHVVRLVQPSEPSTDETWEEAKALGLTTFTIIGEDSDGMLCIHGNANVGEMLVLMELAKKQAVFGDVE